MALRKMIYLHQYVAFYATILEWVNHERVNDGAKNIIHVCTFEPNITFW
jgi:hypothetical protein